MGTVGLSFGSPTSGTGFDVSTTVSAIVANLQNVETPWKTQLATLQKQDTVISSLGTLMSNLSSDMDALTDLSTSGVMNTKMGSSSDDSVLELTAASSSAVAGTHTVVVTSLATTSSGYLAPISDSSDELSGSITLQVGSGTAQTISMPSSGGTLTDLEDAINSSSVGITASILTDSSGSRLSLVSSTSGAKGNITVSSNSIVDTTSHLSYSGSAGTSSTNSTGTFTGITNAADTLSGSISIQVGNGAAQTVTVATSSNTLATLADAINSTTGIGVQASVVTNTDGTSSLQLVSSTGGTAGNLTVTSDLVDSSTAASTSLSYTSPVAGADAKLTVDGVDLTSASNTVANLIPGVTFQMLSPSASGSSVQVVIGNYTTGVESAVNTMVSDYNSLISAVQTQEGNDSSGNPEPLYGSPTLSLLQQQLLSGLNMQNPNGYLDSISTNTDTTLSGKMYITVGDGTKQEIDVPASPNNTLQDLADAINAVGDNTTIAYSGTPGSDGVTSTGTLSASSTASLAGSISIQVGNGTAVTVDVPDSPNDGIEGLTAAINNASGIGVTASYSITNGVATMTLTSNTPGSDGTLTVNSNVVIPGAGFSANVVTSDGQSTLNLLSQTAGSTGALTVSSSITATSDRLLSYSGSAGTSTAASSGVLTTIAKSSDTLSGSISIQVGSGAAQTIDVDPSNTTLSGLADAINNAKIGVTASLSSDGTTLSLASGTPGTDGTMTVTSNILDTTDTSATTLNYTNSSDLSTLANLGITASSSYDGTLTFDVATLDSALNSDFSGVASFFQNANSWGQNFSTILSNAGSSSSSGFLTLATNSNSSTESTLNADISRENSMISAEQVSLTAELNSANEILQQLPTQLDGINQLYSAITGYNENQS